ncbi:MAG: class I SAM-dependent methyltransferase [Candidatus Nitrosopolaris sp.]
MNTKPILPVLDAISELEKKMFQEKIYDSADIDLELEIELRLLRIIANLARGGEKQNKLFYEAERKWNLHILPCNSNYSYKSPLPKVSELSDKLWDKQYIAGIDWNEKESLKLLDKLARYSTEYGELIKSGKFDTSQGAFIQHDPAVYYCLIRHFKPKHIIEVGIGSSTRLASLAKNENQNENYDKIAHITAIDPYYESPDLDEIVDEIIRKPVQEVPASEFNKLEENDILFIDSSHVSKVGSDVNYLFLEILPLLKPGVIVHVHDICLPDEMPESWIKSKAIFWNEQYLLNAFLIFNSKFRILVSNHYMGRFHPDALLKIYNNEPVGGGSFWIQKTQEGIYSS